MSPGEHNGIGLKPERHIAGFSIRREDGTNIPLIYEAAVGKARDTVVLKLDKARARERDALVRPRHRALLQPDRRAGHGSAGLRPDSDSTKARAPRPPLRPVSPRQRRSSCSSSPATMDTPGRRQPRSSKIFWERAIRSRST